MIIIIFFENMVFYAFLACLFNVHYLIFCLWSWICIFCYEYIWKKVHRPITTTYFIRLHYAAFSTGSTLTAVLRSTQPFILYGTYVSWVCLQHPTIRLQA